MSQLTVAPAVELLAMLRAGKISTVELTQEYIREIERLDPQLHAFAHFDSARALAAARACEKKDAPHAPLLGLPMSIKSSIATAGYRCEIGSQLHRGSIPQENAVIVERMLRAGAVLLGTTNCPEFLMAYETDNLLYGAAANPWDLERNAGGSSGGESAAIAAGMSAGGFGSDSGGSVREPAHFTGICSLKPTPGRIPGRGHLPACNGPFDILGAVGPMARTMRDVSLFFRTLSGPDSLDPVSAPVPFRNVQADELKFRPIAILEDDGLIPVTPETRQAIRDAAQALQERGFCIEVFRSSSLEPARKLWWQFFMRCGRMLLEPLVAGHEEELSRTFRYYLDVVRKEPVLSNDELLTAWMQCDEVRSSLLRDLEPFSALLCPVAAIPAFRHGERSWKIEGQEVEYFSAMRFTQWFNLLASPAAVVPVGRSSEGLPIGVQVVGRPYCDEEVLRIAELVDEDFGYKPPPLALK